jgi:putative ABC transport system permease protein
MSAFVNIKLGTPVVPPALVGIWFAPRCVHLCFVRVDSGDQSSAHHAIGCIASFRCRCQLPETNRIFFLIGSIFIGVGSYCCFPIKCHGCCRRLAFLLGLVCITPAVVRPFALLFGKIIARIYHRQGIGELAQGNMARHPGRTAITVSATLLGLAVAVAAGTLVSSVSISVANLIRYLWEAIIY